MSRIGRLPVTLSDKITVKQDGATLIVKWPLWELTYTHTDAIEVKHQDNELVVALLDESRKALWGTTRSILANMVEGVTNGYKKALEINGVGYKFEIQGTLLVLSIGYSHKVDMQMPAGIKVEMDEKLKNTLHISGIDKQLVGEVAAKIRAKKKPEPYKGKGIKYVGEHVRRKAGKTGS